MTTKKRVKKPAKPSFADEKTWQAYHLILEKIARDRNYTEIGASRVITLIGGSLGLTNRTSIKIKDILHRLSKKPYQWICLSPDGAMQIKVKPLDDVIKNNDGEASV